VGLASRPGLRYPDGAVNPLSRTTLLAAFALAGLSGGCSGCDEKAHAGQPDAADAPAPPSSSARTPPAASAAPSGSAAADKAPLQLLKLVFTSEVKNKEPVDKLERAQPGQRVWVHLTLRNRGADTRPITMTFKVNGDQRTKVDLKVDPSWSFRTWGYNTLRAGDQTGELVVEVRDDGGALLTTARLPIKTDGTKPLDPK
jgi:hypothetical protein